MSDFYSPLAQGVNVMFEGEGVFDVPSLCLRSLRSSVVFAFVVVYGFRRYGILFIGV